jgi:hypothetical protein
MIECMFGSVFHMSATSHFGGTQSRAQSKAILIRGGATGLGVSNGPCAASSRSDAGHRGDGHTAHVYVIVHRSSVVEDMQIVVRS